LAALIVGRPTPCALERLERDDALTVARAHGVLPLVAESLARRADLPAPLVRQWQQAASLEVAIDIVREAELRRVIEALHQASRGAIWLKGAPLAYQLYRRPDLRPRLDADVLIREADRGAVHDDLVGLGYARSLDAGGTHRTYQATYVCDLRPGVTHALDVHWRVANPQVFAGLLEYDEIAADAVRVPRLSPFALAPGDVHALLLACVHRIAHHDGAERLIWLYDIHVLSGALDAPGWRAFEGLARDRGVTTLCRASLRHAVEAFGTALPDSVDAALASETPRGKLVAGYLAPQRPIWRLTADLRAVASWRDRWRLAQEHLFPPADYMRQVYAPESHAPLAWLYVRRAAVGARRFFARA
jgi:hypothetical protein